MQITERVLCVAIGGACVVATAGLLMGSTFEEMSTLVAAFGFGAALPSPITKQG